MIANQLDYSYVHPNLPVGTNYYRLKILDQSAKETYSRTVLLVVGNKATVITRLRPTMVRETTFVDIYSSRPQSGHTIIYDVTGRAVSEMKGVMAQGENSVRLNTSMLVQGMYTVHVITEDGVVGNLRFVKE
jgi:hypothetical protein